MLCTFWYCETSSDYSHIYVSASESFLCACVCVQLCVQMSVLPRAHDMFILKKNSNMKIAGIFSGFQPKVAHENTFTRKLSYMPLPRLWKEICSWVQAQEPHCISPWKGWFQSLTIAVSDIIFVLFCFQLLYLVLT